MIIKIKHKDSWIFYDELSKVRYETASITNFISIETDANWITEGSTDAVLIHSRKKNGEEFVILANERTYLLNDEGKTIERLN
jgi:hypothetical protein